MIQSFNSNLSPQLLVVDDFTENLRLLKTVLQQQGYEVRLAANGKFALTSLDHFQPDLILLDIMMPEMNGYLFCQELKQNPKTSDIPVIFLSALQEGMDKAKAFQLGGADYLTKPFQMEELLARVKHHLELRDLQRELQLNNNFLEIKNRQLQKTQGEMSLMLDVTKIINDVFDIKLAISQVLDRVCRHILWDYAEAWIPNHEETLLTYIPCLETGIEKFQEFQEKSGQITLAPNQGLPGRIWTSQKPEWIHDCCNDLDNLCVGKELAEKSEFKSVFGVPIVASQTVLAILVFYKLSVEDCQDYLVDLIQAVVNQLASPLEKSKLYQQLEMANQELERLANRDGLTQVANRRVFDSVLEKEWLRMKREQKCLSLVLCDVDYFKKYNDFYGHLSGDDCLIAIAGALTKAARRPGDLVARYGGEEFAIILPSTNRNGACDIARSLQKEMADLQIIHEESEIARYVTLSLGISSVIPSDNWSVKSLINAADQALYQAKKLGRNGFCCHPLDDELC
ncbi:diguanylate cyclase [Roseofilum reptotaenium CS-1145]|uniref:Diguanylate cyclase n=2 Tax=Roseofilum TaxID=1233426 RepID=A0A1L9QVQ0_9CYAN|nr:diguanylate cyclase [Roseofilum reptotaenium]MDB9520285.1 diguanylate cyclase [Roseofilum reptotaenium CS-1145]OJJ26677.1 hypothetical protein BI308_04685 [Roseofilum reptotaenium AO1-A]